MKHSIALFAIFSIILALAAPTPASALWPFHHNKSAHVTARFVGINTEPVSSATLSFVSSNGKSTVVRADKDGKVTVSLRPGRSTLIVKNGSDLVFRAAYNFSAGTTDLSVVDPITGTYEGLSTFPSPPRIVGTGVILGAIKTNQEKK